MVNYRRPISYIHVVDSNIMICIIVQYFTTNEHWSIMIILYSIILLMNIGLLLLLYQGGDVWVDWM